MEPHRTRVKHPYISHPGFLGSRPKTPWYLMFSIDRTFQLESLMASWSHPSRLSGESRNPRPPGIRTPASCHRHRRPSRLSGESRNPRPLPGVRMPASCHRHRRPSVFPAKAGTHVPSSASVCPPVAIDTATPPACPAKAGTHVLPVSVRPPVAVDDATTPHRLSGESRNPRPLPDVHMPASWRKGTLDIGVTSNLSK